MRSPSPKEDIIPKLVRVFRRYGYDGATLSRISEATGLGRASLYHHFPNGKQEMAEAVLTYVGQVFRDVILEPLIQGEDPRQKVQGMSEGLNQFYRRGQDACLLAVFSLGEAGEMFHEQIRSSLNAWITSLAQTLVEAGLDETTAHHRAEEAVMQIQGGLLLSRGLNSTEPFERAVTELPKKLLMEP